MEHPIRGRPGSFRSLFTIIIARLVGPQDFGIVAQAMVYVGIVALLVDQGFSSALIQRKHVRPEMPGVVVSVNIGVGTLLDVVDDRDRTAVGFVHAHPGTTPRAHRSSPSLVIRSVGITARGMLMRDMDFRTIGIADTASTIVGGAPGGRCARRRRLLVSCRPDSAPPTLCTKRRRPRSARAGGRTCSSGCFGKSPAVSARAFAAGVLINSVSRNIDNLLIGRFQGPQALAFTGLAYRLLLLPVQLAGQRWAPYCSRHSRRSLTIERPWRPRCSRHPCPRDVLCP